MKTRLMAGFLLAVAAAASLPAQGTFVFSNNIQAKTVRITDCDGKPASGDAFKVEILVRNPETRNFDTPIEILRPDKTWAKATPVGFLEGTGAGIFHGGTARVPFLAPGKEAELNVRVWQAASGATFDTAKVRGQTNITVKLGGIGSPPSFPARLRTLQGIKLCP